MTPSIRSRWMPFAGAWLAASLALVTGFAPPAPAATIDHGVFKTYLRGRAMGREIFTYDLSSDSLSVTSDVRQIVLAPTGDDTLLKSVTLLVNAFDLDLRSYQSSQTIRSERISRKLQTGDTSLTVFRQVNEYGTSDVIPRPPGRIFVHDPDVYVLFDVIARNLHTQTFDSRPITLIVLGPRDTTVEVTATRLPSTPHRWGGTTVTAGHLELNDGVNRVVLWSDGRGRLIEFDVPAAGLVVVRDPPATRPPRHGPAPPR